MEPAAVKLSQMTLSSRPIWLSNLYNDLHKRFSHNTVLLLVSTLLNIALDRNDLFHVIKSFGLTYFPSWFLNSIRVFQRIHNPGLDPPLLQEIVTSVEVVRLLHTLHQFLVTKKPHRYQIYVKARTVSQQLSVRYPVYSFQRKQNASNLLFHEHYSETISSISVEDHCRQSEKAEIFFLSR